MFLPALLIVGLVIFTESSTAQDDLPKPKSRLADGQHTTVEKDEKGKGPPISSAEGMRFTQQFNGGNCESCSWVLAEGDIEPGTTERFKAFAKMADLPGNIRFNSRGGDVIEALKFGRFLRESNWDTFVGDEGYIGISLDDYKTQQSNCYSACVYVFAGGVHRTAADRSVGIHQFYRRGDGTRSNDKTLSAVDVANMQKLAALLNEYVRRMGVDPRLVTIASTITPWEPIYLLSSAEMNSLNLDNESTPSNEASAGWMVQPLGNGAMAATQQTQDGAGRVASLGIMCLQPTPGKIIVRLTVRDDTKDWGHAFGLDLLPLGFIFAIDGKFDELNGNRLVSPVRVMSNGATFAVAISNDELGRMISAKSVDMAASLPEATSRWTGRLGGTFSMAGAPDVIGLALKNCVGERIAIQ